MAAQLPFFRVYPQQKADFVLKKRPIELGAFPGWIVCLDHKNIRVCIREIKTPGLRNWDRLWPKWGAPDLFSCWLQVRVLTSCQKQKILTHSIIICDVTTSTPDWKVLNCLICAATASTAETQKNGHLTFETASKHSKNKLLEFISLQKKVFIHSRLDKKWSGDLCIVGRQIR